jgi:acyl-coenzyme A thioesterase PaaI-like protein
MAAKGRGDLPLAPCSMLLGCYDPIARDGTSGLSLRATPWLAGPTGTVYGGVLALLLDIVMTAPRAQ